MKAYELTDHDPALVAGSLLLDASTAVRFVRYEEKDGNRLKYLPYLPPNYSLYPAGALLGDEYSLLDFQRFAEDLGRATGLECLDFVMELWTFAYYTGWAGFNSSEVFIATDGVNFSLPPLFNYSGAFQAVCDYESLRPPQRAFQCYWHFFSEKVHSVKGSPLHIVEAVSHFTSPKFYR